LRVHAAGIGGGADRGDLGEALYPGGGGGVPYPARKPSLKPFEVALSALMEDADKVDHVIGAIDELGKRHVIVDPAREEHDLADAAMRFEVDSG
jgi:hypothetical protein